MAASGQFAAASDAAQQSNNSNTRRRGRPPSTAPANATTSNQLLTMHNFQTLPNPAPPAGVQRSSVTATRRAYEGASNQANIARFTLANPSRLRGRHPHPLMETICSILRISLDETYGYLGEWVMKANSKEKALGYMRMLYKLNCKGGKAGIFSNIPLLTHPPLHSPAMCSQEVLKIMLLKRGPTNKTVRQYAAELGIEFRPQHHLRLDLEAYQRIHGGATTTRTRTTTTTTTTTTATLRTNPTQNATEAEGTSSNGISVDINGLDGFDDDSGLYDDEVDAEFVEEVDEREEWRGETPLVSLAEWNREINGDLLDLPCEGVWSAKVNEDGFISTISTLHQVLGHEKDRYLPACRHCVDAFNTDPTNHQGCHLHPSPQLVPSGNPTRDHQVLNYLKLVNAHTAGMGSKQADALTPNQVFNAIERMMHRNNLYWAMMATIFALASNLYLREHEVEKIRFEDILWTEAIRNGAGEIDMLPILIGGKEEIAPVKLLLWRNRRNSAVCPITILMKWMALIKDRTT
ncbi:hypothetical protein HDU76_009341, partial [Blyttiomyces sp. JEL0837]